MEAIKKIGTTPEIEEATGGAEILGVIEPRSVMVKMRDGNGIETVKMGFVVPGGELYFLEEKSFKQAQKWVRNGVLKKLSAS